ncbi:lipoprotein [Antarctobacter heliothermus]|uniref:Lipoprotein n=1 Tax=Antarctobacter heliothermus TaxID=74033 RepID=A0A222E8U4_9RHOB|nr:lipoprotein [Antarctobacter heliothermus]
MVRRVGTLGAVATLLMTLLAGCFRLETEAEVRAHLNTWVFLAQTRHFTVRSTCTAAIFDTISGEVRSSGPVRRVEDLSNGQRLLAEGRTVAFELPGLSPNEVSEALMSVNLSEGLGLISSFVGPSQACMTEAFQNDIYLALMSPDTGMIYDPSRNALVLLHRPSQIAFYLRGNV